MTKPKKFYGVQSIDQRLGDLLQPLFHGSKKEFSLISNLAKNWHKIVGEKYAHLCYPKSFVGAIGARPLQSSNGHGRPPIAPTKSEGKLTIAVYNPAIGFFLESNSDLIIERLAVFCGFKMISKIIIKQEPRQLEGHNEKEIHLNKEQHKFLDKGVKSIENSELSTILKKIGTKILDEKTN